MKGRIKFWLLAFVLGALPVLLLGRWARPISAAGPGAAATGSLAGSTKTVSQHSAVPGQAVKFTITISNASASALAGVTVTDTLPAGLTFANGSLTATTGSYNYSAGVITWTGALTGNASAAIEYRAASLITTSLGTVLTNTALIHYNSETVSRQASFTVEPAKLFLPLVVRPEPGIYGTVSINGTPASGVFLELRKYDGQAFSTEASTNTDSNGRYVFNPASLAPGQSYYVRYLNTSHTIGLLSFWATAEIDSFSAGGSLGAGSFDLADITLVAPDPGATVGLPSPFQWQLRPATPSDSYQLSLFDPGGSGFGQTTPLGYVNGILLNGLPAGFNAGTTYGWYMAVNEPDGGYGESFYYREVRFNNVLAPSRPAGPAGVAVRPAQTPRDRPRR